MRRTMTRLMSSRFALLRSAPWRFAPRRSAKRRSARLGHADPAFTARTYIHRDDDRARALANLADDLRGAGR